MTPELAGSAEGAVLLERLPHPPLQVVSEALATITDADSPRGAVAVAKLPRGGPEVLPRVAGGVYLFAEGVQDPGNLGALARLAEAAGASGMACSEGCAHPNHPRALRASAGSLLRLPVAYGVTPGEVADRLSPLKARWVALSAGGGKSLFDEQLDGTLVLVLGSEGAGISTFLLHRAELTIEIPMQPPVESLNVASAAAVVLFELRRRRGGVLSLPSPPESPP